MARKKLLHLKSGVTIQVDGNTIPKLPTSEQIDLGEIAINYAEGYETIAIKNSNSEIVTFSNDKIIMDYVDEKVVQGIDPVQTTGTSTGDVMSQSAVTRELSNKLAVNDFNTYSGAVDASIAGKASQGDLNALSDVVTAHTANTIVHVTSSDKAKWNSVDDKLNTSDFNTYSGNVDTTISGKVDKVSGKGLSTNDYTTAEKEKLQGIAAGAEVNVQADWNESIITADSYILNKPTLGTAAAKGVSAGITNTDNLIESKHIYSGVGVTITYDSANKYIQLKSTSGNVLSSFDATAFIKDGMVSNVEINNGNLVITFNSDSGKEAISIPLTSIFDPSNYYTKSETSGKTEISTALNSKSDTGHIHAISDVTNLQSTLNGKANTATTLSGYGITDAKIANGVITLGSNTITPLTSHQSLSDYYKKSELTGSSTNVIVAKAASATTAANATTANSVAWENISGKPDTFAPSAHNQASNTITTMAGYSKATSASAIATSDTLNAAIGKLEKALDGKQPSGSYLTSHQTVTLASGTDNGTLKITTAAGTTDNVAVKGLGNMAYQSTSAYSSATQVNTALSGKSNTGHTHDDRYYTESELTGSSTSVVVAKANSATTAANASTVNGHTVNADVPAGAVFTDNNTTYAAGSFITITGANNAINVSTGSSSSTVARGDHSHNGVYQPVGSYLTAITSSNVTTALGFTPMNNAMLQYSAVTVTTDLNNQVCPVTLTTNGQQCNVLYVNNDTTFNHTVPISTTYKTSDGKPLKLDIKANGYGEVNYLYYGGTIYARGV